MSEIEARENSWTGNEIAVIGMAGRFPGAGNLDKFWDNLKNGVESLSFFAGEELQDSGLNPELLAVPNYVTSRGGVLEDGGYFDAFFFGYTPGEAEVMDPQLRFFHECAWEALENAGYDSEVYDGLIGVYAGASNHFDWQALSMISGKNAEIGEFAASPLYDKDFLSPRIAYKLNLRGTAITVNTACSTSLVAVHLASQAILDGECDIALAGGVSMNNKHNDGYLYQEGMINSSDGHCRAFDARSTGTIGGNGIGIVVLKALAEALEDGDYVHAVIKGTAANNDGINKAAYTAPSREGQTKVIRVALRVAEVEPASITYVETHGTGTVLGDPIEIEALKQSFNTDEKGFCAIGSVKTNIGHLDASAGIAGFIKAVLALKYRLIPPSLHYETPNPKIDFENSPFYVNAALTEWKNETYPLRAGVSSFGIGGTNAHVILEEAPAAADSADPQEGRGDRLILLSAKTRSALEKITENLANHLKQNPRLNLADAAYTLQVGRRPLKHRRATVCSTVDQLISALDSPTEGNLYTSFTADENRPVVFMFSGQGSQYVNMGLDLYRREPVFRETMDHCFERLKALMDDDIKEILYPPAGSGPDPVTTTDKINRTEITQPVLFIFEYALAQLLMKWGIKPYAMIGHSIGEYTAACLSGVFSLEDALELVVLRGRLMQQMPAGDMLSVPLSEKELKPLLQLDENRELALAAVNGPSLCVVSGPGEAVDVFSKFLNKRGTDCSVLHTSHAFHSKMMDPILEEFEGKVKQIRLNKPIIPYISNVTGGWITVDEAVNPGYWAKHVRNPVRFAGGIETILKRENPVFVEVGPGKTLNTFVRQHQDRENKTAPSTVNLIRHPKEKIPDNRFFLSKIGQLWLHGVTVDWFELYKEKRLRIPLPTYPFESQRYWIDGNPFTMWMHMASRQPLNKRKDINRWFYLPSWERSLWKLPGTGEGRVSPVWLLFVNGFGLGSRLAERLKQNGSMVVTVNPGEIFCKISPLEYVIDPSRENHYDSLFRELKKLGDVPYRILHLWGVTNTGMQALEPETIEKSLNLGFYSLLHIARASSREFITGEIRITAVTDHMQEVDGQEELCPVKATLLGAVKVVPLEYPNINCRSIDIVLPQSGSLQEQSLADHLLLEFTADYPYSGQVVAYRGKHRWVQAMKPFTMKGSDEINHPLKKEGVYLITGGLGGIGLTIAEHLARSLKAKLILLERFPIPAREEWEHWMENHQDAERDVGKIEKLIELEKTGAEVLVLSGDVSDKKQMQEVMEQAQKRFGQINGVIHCAGLPDGGIIQQRTRETIEDNLAPKLIGTVVLDELLKNGELDFFFLCSSLSSVLGPFGQVAYCAANSFLDAFAHYKMLNGRTLFVSVNWDTWQEAGMAVDASSSPDELKHGILASEGKELFNRILGFSIPQVTVSTRDLQLLIEQRYAESGEDSKADESIDTEATSGIVHQRPEISTAYVEPRNKLEQVLAHIWEEYFGIDRVGIHDDFFELGGDSLKGMRFVNRYNELLRDIVHVNIMFSAPTIAELSAYFDEHYPAAAARIKGTTPVREAVSSRKKIDDAAVRKFLRLIPKLPHREEAETRKNPSAVFILAPPRSGTTLLRVMLGGHPRLFAPPELGLMTVDYLEDVIDDQGAVRAVMQIKECSSEEARRIIQELKNKHTASLEFFRLLQGWIDDRILVEKTPNYGLNPDILERIERGFENPVYIHLMRHPYGMIRSFEEAKIDLLAGKNLLKELSLTRPQLAELVWLINHQNIAAFLKDIPGERQYYLKFEEMVSRPRQVMEDICERLGLDVHPDMLEPYKEKKQRMTDGIHKEGMMIGDVKFHTHKRIDPEVGDNWRKHYHVDFLGDATWQLAESFGYKRINEPAYPSIEPVELKEYYAVSSAQRRLYILQQMETESKAYNMPLMISLPGQHEDENLERAFRELVERRENLRTSFEVIDGEPVQRIHQQVDFEIQYREAGDKEEESRVISELITPFDLSRPPLFRIGLVKVKTEEYILLVDIHHIITDGTSQAILIEEFKALYMGVELPPLRIHYRDYSEWENSREVQEIFKGQGEFWQKVFEGEIPVLHLPTDYQRPPVQSFEGNATAFEVDRKETKRLNEIARAEKATLFMVILAVYNILLSKLSNQEDIVIGIPIEGRHHAGLEEITGMVVNTLPLRNFPSEEKSFDAFLREVKERALDAFANQNYPFEDLVENVAVERDLSRNPLFDVMFTFQRESEQPSETGQIPEDQKIEDDAEIKPYAHERRSAKLDINLLGGEIRGKLYITFEYCARLFNEDTMLRFGKYFKKIISVIVENPDEKISEIEIISEEEKKQILFDFNDNSADFRKHKTVCRIIEEHAGNAPDRAAVVFKDAVLTYGNLNERSNALARELREKGITGDALVGVLCERSMEMLLGILAVWKAGGAYIPIDIDYPPGRIATILSNSGAEVLFTTANALSGIHIDAFYRGHIIYPDSMETHSRENLQRVNEPSDLSYVIYTSGSTGKPKGAMVEHIGMMNHLQAKIAELHADRTSIIAQNASHTFDISVWQFMTALLVGGKTAIYPNRLILSPEKFLDRMIIDQVTILEVVPSYLSVMLDYIGRRQLPLPICYLLVTGEEIKPNLVEKWFEKYPGIKMVNAYGPTEASDDITHYVMDKALHVDRIPIGKPLQNLNIYIVNRNMKLCPIGVKGEIWVSGVGVGRGYLKDEEKTGQAFMEDPFAEEPGIRLYKTGDLGRWLPDGNIEFFGRKDYQVKIRGFRIELGEIEIKLASHPQIKEAVVIAADAGGGKPSAKGEPAKYLCAYFVSDNEIPVPELKKFLMKELPEYMVPSYFVPLENLPLTPNGKIDRKALPDPELEADEGYIAPRNPLEEKLAEIWSEVLGIGKEVIGVDSNFFELGGHSLNAAIFVAKLHRQLNVKLPMAEIFKTPVIRDLSQYISGAGEEKFLSIEPAEEKEYYRLSSVQRRLYFVHLLAPSSTSYNIPSIIPLEGEADKERLEQTFKKLIARHENLRTSFVMPDKTDEPVQKIYKTAGFAVESDDRKGKIYERIKRFIRPFDLSQAPLLRAGVIMENPRKPILMVEMHHIITDGISDDILVQDFIALYAGRELPPLRLQYKDFSEWQNQLVGSGKMDEQKKYWAGRFDEGDIPVLNMPLDYPRPSVRNVDEGNHMHFTLDIGLCERLSAAAKETGTTLFMLLLAAYNVLLYKFTKQEDFVVGTLLTGRSHADLENIIGMFVNTLPIRNFPGKNKIFKAFLMEVKENLLSAYENQDYPLDELIIDLGLQGDPSRNPLFDTVFTLNPMARGEETETEPPDPEEAPYDPDVKFAKFDLYFLVNDFGGKIDILIRYSTQLFKISTIERIKKYFIEILDQVTGNPGVTLKDIALSHDFLTAESGIRKDEEGDFIF